MNLSVGLLLPLMAFLRRFQYHETMNTEAALGLSALPLEIQQNILSLALSSISTTNQVCSQWRSLNRANFVDPSETLLDNYAVQRFAHLDPSIPYRGDGFVPLIRALSREWIFLESMNCTESVKWSIAKRLCRLITLKNLGAFPNVFLVLMRLEDLHLPKEMMAALQWEQAKVLLDSRKDLPGIAESTIERAKKLLTDHPRFSESFTFLILKLQEEYGLSDADLNAI